MTRRTALINFTIITGIVVILYIAAVNVGLFWIFDWFDSVMHLIGGIAIGYLALAIIPPRLSRGLTMARAVGLAASIGIAWEIFERVGSYIVPSLLAYGGLRDTVMDIVYAIIGALIVVISTTSKEKI